MLQGDYQTPSPADSAVHDLGGGDSREAERHSDQAILPPPSAGPAERKSLKKEKPGKKDAVQKVKSFYEAQLKHFQQNAAKMEESLVNQIYQVRNSLYQAVKLKCENRPRKVLLDRCLLVLIILIIFRLRRKERRLSWMWRGSETRRAGSDRKTRN